VPEAVDKPHGEKYAFRPRIRQGFLPLVGIVFDGSLKAGNIV